MLPRASIAVLLAAAALALPARAWPVDVYADLEAGKERFFKLAAVDWAVVEDPKIASAERVETGELLLTGVAPGRTLLLLYGEGKFGVWRVRVAPKDGKLPPLAAGPQLSPAVTKACPKAKLTGEGDARELSATVPDDACRRALLPLFEQDGLNGRQLLLTFEVPALQAQLAATQAALPAALRAKVTLKYLGAGLVLEGALTQQEHREVLWTLFRQAVGRVALDDRAQLP